MRPQRPVARSQWGLALVLLFAAWLGGCDNGNALEDFGELLDLGVCAPDAGPFTLEITHPFMPLPVGRQIVLEGEDDGELLRVRITVLDETEVVAGVTTRVVEEREWEDGELVEVSRNFFAQAPDGTVCYFGEDVDDYEDGRVVAHDGAWRADGTTNLSGIIMPANPEVGMAFKLESAPGIAEDEVKILAFGEAVDTPLGRFEDTMRIKEQNPIDKDSDEKVFARTIGIIIDADVPIVSFTPGGE